VRVGIHAPQLGRAVSPELLVEIAQQAEAAGFADLWFSDHVAVPAGSGMPAFFPEPVPLMAAAAAHTQRLGLGTSVMIPAYRNPMHLAKQWATLDWLAPGRTILGVGAGWLPEEFAACGVPLKDRGRRLDDYIRGWKALWAGAQAHDGEFFSFRNVRLKPSPRSPIPVWIGGSSAGALRRAAWCDGWHPTWAPLEEFTRNLGLLRAEMDRLGRDHDAVTISMHAEVHLGQAPTGSGYWSEAGDHHEEASALSGTPADIADHLRPYAEAGLEHVVLTPQCHSADEWRATVAELAAVARLLAPS
jgi:probable F420-dependent oxidoreductase